MKIILPDGQEVETPFAEPYDTRRSERFAPATLQVGDVLFESDSDGRRYNYFALALTFPVDAEVKKHKGVFSYYFLTTKDQEFAVLANTYLDVRIGEIYVEYSFSPPSTPYLRFLFDTRVSQQRFSDMLKEMNGLAGSYQYEDTLYRLSELEKRNPRHSDKDVFVYNETKDKYEVDIDADIEDDIRLVTT